MRLPFPCTRALVAEDDPEVAEVVREHLEELTAARGPDAPWTAALGDLPRALRFDLRDLEGVGLWVEGALCAVALYEPDDEAQPEVVVVAARPAARARGALEEVLAALERQLSDRGHTRLSVLLEPGRADLRGALESLGLTQQPEPVPQRLRGTAFSLSSSRWTTPLRAPGALSWSTLRQGLLRSLALGMPGLAALAVGSGPASLLSGLGLVAIPAAVVERLSRGWPLGAAIALNAPLSLACVFGLWLQFVFVHAAWVQGLPVQEAWAAVAAHAFDLAPLFLGGVLGLIVGLAVHPWPSYWPQRMLEAIAVLLAVVFLALFATTGARLLGSKYGLWTEDLWLGGCGLISLCVVVLAIPFPVAGLRLLYFAVDRLDARIPRRATRFE
ncbi:MAG: hypothetical protein AB7N76_31740 [Planctomycetota bacterium]